MEFYLRNSKRGAGEMKTKSEAEWAFFNFISVVILTSVIGYFANMSLLDGLFMFVGLFGLRGFIKGLIK